MTYQFKTGGPNVEIEVIAVRCCRIWPVVTTTLQWEEGIDGWKRESWWWRTCGLCGGYPRPVNEEEGRGYSL
jgi:hypothetical protein